MNTEKMCAPQKSHSTHISLQSSIAQMNGCVNTFDVFLSQNGD